MADVQHAIPQTFTAGAPLMVVHGICFRTDCVRTVEITLDADGLDITTKAVLEAVVPEEGLICYNACKMHVTTLELDPLPEGEHVVTYGDDSLVLQIPATRRACLGAFPFGVVDDDHVW